MIFASTDGTRRTIGRILANDNTTTIVPNVPAGQKVTLDSIWVSCDGTGTAIDLWWSNGDDDFYLYQGKAVPANDGLLITDFHVSLRQGWSLKCRAATANHLTVTAVVIEGNASKGSNSQ